MMIKEDSGQWKLFDAGGVFQPLWRTHQPVAPRKSVCRSILLLGVHRMAAVINNINT